MNTLAYRQFYHRHLPHIVPPGSTFFVTFRLIDSIPKAEVRSYKARLECLEDEMKRLARQNDESPEAAAHLERLQSFKRDWFVKFEDILHKARIGPVWLKDGRVAKIVVDSLHFLDGRSYTLNAYCVMSNHVHAVFRPLLTEADLCEEVPESGYHFTLARIMKSLKGFTAREANRVLGRKGNFWEPETYDHFVRDATEYDRIIRYVLNNPVKAGLVKNWQEWEWSYRK
ncbi:MAG: hypothetical protein J2P41_11520 [Blastocatellia bacterium]|nr:hypothetical protein [Blastocatellia bacterium]